MSLVPSLQQPLVLKYQRNQETRESFVPSTESREAPAAATDATEATFTALKTVTKSLAQSIK